MSGKSPLEVLQSLGLEEVQQQIAALESQIDGLQKQIDSLRVLERAIEYRENGRPQRKPRKPKQGGEDVHSDADLEREAPRPTGRQPSEETVRLRAKLADVLKRRGEPLSVGQLTRIVGEPYGPVQNALNGKQFRKTDAGYVLAE